ncbi:hypothetical protein FGO68_gene5550 [Halteria grandinella]|uniref:Uncharacterized protein n=1 Tax=Halteria grandinella TaxID=5974 RepID=A0A8J8NK30_HALGN|nr:hypothetical protein FGO68_gene5550 [Halteria grandinella]
MDTSLIPPGFTLTNHILYGTTNDGMVMHLKLQRPDKKNAMYSEMYDTMNEVMLLAAKDPLVKALLIYGANGNLSAGNDLKAALSSQKQRSKESFVKMFWDTVTFPKPLYYLVQGCCIGVVPPLVAYADFVYCTEDAYFVMPFMALNLATEGMSPITFPELVGRRKAAEMILTDVTLGAKEAVAKGFANGIVNGTIETEPIIGDPTKCIPGLKKLLQADISTLMRAKELMTQGRSLERLQSVNKAEMDVVTEIYKSQLFKDTVDRYMKAAINKGNPKL